MYKEVRYITFKILYRKLKHFLRTCFAKFCSSPDYNFSCKTISIFNCYCTCYSAKSDGKSTIFTPKGYINSFTNIFGSDTFNYAAPTCMFNHQYNAKMYYNLIRAMLLAYLNFSLSKVR